MSVKRFKPDRRKETQEAVEAIRQYCLKECSNDDPEIVSGCQLKECPLFDFRIDDRIGGKA